MPGFLLDTNVVSEMTRSDPDPAVAGFLLETPETWLSALVVHEIEYGVRLLPPGRRLERLELGLSRIMSMYSDRILPVDEVAAQWAAQFRADEVLSGRTPDLADILIAGTARANDLTVATRNIAHFRALAVDVVNPWETP